MSGNDQLRSVQFHPSLSYEDFVRGYRPSGAGLVLADGIFLQVVEAARAQPDIPHVLIIEEINRGNPAQVFGEMLTLLENTKRSRADAMELAYRKVPGEKVHVPDNVYIIGPMNIADRSLALVDFALRRRFAFITLEPLLNQAWADWCRARGLHDEVIDLIRDRMTALNDSSTSRRIVIDTKFTAILTTSRYRDQVVRSGYLYQMYAYLRTQERAEDPASLTAEGLLLHPQIGGALDEAMMVQGHRMRFKTIDLTAPSGTFEENLRAIV